MLTAKDMINWFVTKGAESARLVQDTGRTCTLEVVMTREIYERNVEQYLDAENPATGVNPWLGELRGIERIGEESASNQTGRGHVPLHHPHLQILVTMGRIARPL